MIRVASPKGLVDLGTTLSARFLRLLLVALFHQRLSRLLFHVLFGVAAFSHVISPLMLPDQFRICAEDKKAKRQTGCVTI